MNYKVTTVICFILIFLAGYLLFSMKREVEGVNFELSEVQKQIKNESDTIGLLKAELSYLSSPQRIRKLSNQYLKLSNVIPQQMVQDPLNQTIQITYNDRISEDKELLSNKSPLVKISSKSVRWRYKNIGDKYVHRASLRGTK